MKNRERDRLVFEPSEKDAHWGDGAFARENGKYGSHLVHDDDGHESNP